MRDLLVEGETIAVAGGLDGVPADECVDASGLLVLPGAGRFDLCPNGIPGVEVRLPLLYSEGVVRGRMSLPRLVEVTAAAPARLAGLDKRLQERLGVPVLDGVVCGLIIAFGLSRYGASTSKARRYNPE